jgi:hypothetical protein
MRWRTRLGRSRLGDLGEQHRLRFGVLGTGFLDEDDTCHGGLDGSASSTVPTCEASSFLAEASAVTSAWSPATTSARSRRGSKTRTVYPLRAKRIGERSADGSGADDGDC